MVHKRRRAGGDVIFDGVTEGRVLEERSEVLLAPGHCLAFVF